VASLSSLGLLPGSTLVCAFVVIAARPFLGELAMFIGLALTSAAVVLVGLARAQALPSPEVEGLGAWFWVRTGLGFALPTAGIALIVAHVVGKIEHSLLAKHEALRRSSLAEAERERTQAALAKTEEALLRSQKLEAVGRLAA